MTGIPAFLAQARAATKELPQPGLLQMLLVRALDDGNVAPYRYALMIPSKISF